MPVSIASVTLIGEQRSKLHVGEVWENLHGYNLPMFKVRSISYTWLVALPKYEHARVWVYGIGNGRQRHTPQTMPYISGLQ